MRWLPPLPAPCLAAENLRLPAADRSIPTLAHALSCALPRNGSDRLARSLEQDPSLALWVVCAAGALASGSWRTADDAARWLADNARARLASDDIETWSEISDPSLQADWTAAVEKAFVAAVSAAAGAASASESAEAYWGALVASATHGLGEPLAEAVFAALPLRYSAARARNPWGAESSPTAVHGSGEPTAHAREELAAVAALQAAQWVEHCPAAFALSPQVMRRLVHAQALAADLGHEVEQEKMAALAEFAAGAGHEINNPLGVISGRAQLLLTDESNPERRRSLALIAAQAMRIHEMIADLRHFARPPLPELQTADLTALLDDVVDGFSAATAERGVSLRRTGERQPMPARVDPAQLRVALAAIVRNACDALREGGSVAVEIRSQPGWAVISVQDDGPGMTADERQHALEPYYSARQAGRGLGLGLSKAWRILRQHGGTLRIASEPGNGCTVRIELPAV